MTTNNEIKAPDSLPVMPPIAHVPERGAHVPSPRSSQTFSAQQEESDAQHVDARVSSTGAAASPTSGPYVVAGQEDPYLGTLFGGFEMVAKIGQGGMGLVYKGLQVSLDRVVAVKILNKALCDNPEFIKRFEREAKSVARINHPNILAVYDFGKTEGVWYMVAEYVEGSSLSQQIAERLVIPWEEMSSLIIQCLTGLSHVGQSGIVHRDIKPDNILITRDGIPKIADFGLAKDVSSNDNTDLTTVGMAMGTPAYMSPEQCMGRKLDGRSDIYSLGVTVYYALTGEKPFTGQSSFEIMTKQREHVPTVPCQMNPNVPKEISDLVMRMLAKNPSDRWRDAGDCARDWQDAINRLEDQKNMPAIGTGISASSSSISSGDAKNQQKRKSDEIVIPGTPPLLPPSMSVPPLDLPAARSSSSVSARTSAVSDSHRNQRRPVSESYVADAHDLHPKPSSERHPPRTGTENRVSQRTMTAKETIICPKCDFLNRSEGAMCSRCQYPLNGSLVSTKEQEIHADRLAQLGNHREAAAIYTRLSEHETDRRLRSILRTKEREARGQEQKIQVHDLHARAQGLVNRGDLRGGLQVLERGLREVRDGGANSTAIEASIVTEIKSLRSRRLRQFCVRIILVVVALLVLVVVALQGGFGISIKHFLSSTPSTHSDSEHQNDPVSSPLPTTSPAPAVQTGP